LSHLGSCGSGRERERDKDEVESRSIYLNRGVSGVEKWVTLEGAREGVILLVRIAGERSV